MKQVLLRKLPSAAFSLVEVTLALGLVTFVLVALLGLFSVGLKASRDSANETVLAQIASRVFGQVQEGVLPQPGEEPLRLYYTATGLEQATKTTEALYSVELSTKEPTTLGKAASHFLVLRIDIVWPGGSRTFVSSRAI